MVMMRALLSKNIRIPDGSAVSAAYLDSFVSDRLELGARRCDRLPCSGNGEHDALSERTNLILSMALAMISMCEA